VGWGQLAMRASRRGGFAAADGSILSAQPSTNQVLRAGRPSTEMSVLQTEMSAVVILSARLSFPIQVRVVLSKSSTEMSLFCNVKPAIMVILCQQLSFPIQVRIVLRRVHGLFCSVKPVTMVRHGLGQFLCMSYGASDLPASLLLTVIGGWYVAGVGGRCPTRCGTVAPTHPACVTAYRQFS
jgi:hypothetical protein